MAARPAPDATGLPAMAAIRQAIDSDVYDVYRLNCQAFVEAWSVMAIALWRERDDDLDVWYTQDGKLAAYYMGQNVLDEVHIMQIAVATPFRRHGLGRRLMHYEIERKRADGMSVMMLEVRESNRAAQRMYASLGFSEIGLRNDYYAPVAGHPSENAMVMCIEL